MKLVDWQEERMAIIASAVLTTPVNKETPNPEHLETTLKALHKRFRDFQDQLSCSRCPPNKKCNGRHKRRRGHDKKDKYGRIYNGS